MLVGIIVAAVWLVLGYTALRAAVRSAGMPTGKGVMIFIVLCGPIAWFAEWYARRQDFKQ